MRVVPDSQMTDVCRQLFGEDEDAVGELDEAEKQGENGTSRAFIPFHSIADVTNSERNRGSQKGSSCFSSCSFCSPFHRKRPRARENGVPEGGRLSAFRPLAHY